MKKFLLLVVAFCAISFGASAQGTYKSALYTESNTIGIHGGYGVEISYQRTLGSFNRLELDLGLGFPTYGTLSGIYQWTFDISGAKGLGWYTGPGLGFQFGDHLFGAGILGQIGLEYDFDFPLQLSLDWRPGLYFGNYNHVASFGWTGFSLGIRYRF